MKRLWVVAPILFLCLTLAGCENDSAVSKYATTMIGTEVMQDVFDDGQNTVYIRVYNEKGFKLSDNAVAYIIVKKKEWERKFPNKKVVAMSIVMTNAYVRGLLIHYNNEAAQIQPTISDWKTETVRDEELKEIMEIIQKSRRAP